jgi:hypothetical protein
MPNRNLKDTAQVTKMIEIYCNYKHKEKGLCLECDDLLSYAKKRILSCPYDPKPKCKHCKTHCYAPAYRANIKEVMRFSGMQMVKRGRIDLLFSYFR